MREKISLGCLGASLGLAGTALCARLLAWDLGAAPVAAALATGLALAWTAAPGSASAPAAASCAAAIALCGAVLLPLIGIRLTLTAAVLLAAAALKLGAGAAPGPRRQAPPWAAALCAAAVTLWARILMLLGGDALWSLTVVGSAATAGTAAAAVWNERPESAGGQSSSGLWGIASGLAGLMGLALLRFVGLNEGSAELLQQAAPPDFLMKLGSHAWLAVFACSGAAAATACQEPRRASRLAVAAGALTAAGLASRLWAAPTAASLHGIMVLAGVLAVGPRTLSLRTMLGQGVAAALTAAAWLSYGSLGLVGDIWLNRLNMAFPGGRYLAAWNDSRESLLYYQFSSGATVLLRDGTAWSDPNISARRQVHLAMLAHPQPASLLLQTLSHSSMNSALCYGLPLRLLASRAGQNMIRATWKKTWPPPNLTLDSRGLRRTLGGPQTYDVIIIELSVLPGRPASLDRELLASARAHLNERGLLAVRVPAPRAAQDLPWLLAAAEPLFADIGAFDLPGGPLLILSSEPIEIAPWLLTSRLTDAVKQDDPELAKDLDSIPWLKRKVLPASSARAPSVDKP